MSSSFVENKTIREISKACADLFSQHIHLIDDSNIQRSFRDEFQRFRLWASNIGVFAELHSSLDFRLREVNDVKESFLQQLSTIKDRLNQFQNSVTEVVHLQIEDSTDDDEPDRISSQSSTSSIFQEWGQSQLIQSIHESIDWLHKLSNLVRKASFNNQKKRADNFKPRDNDDNDLTEPLEKYFTALIRKEFDGLQVALTHRLAASMLIRRRRIMYRLSQQKRWDLQQRVEYTAERFNLASQPELSELKAHSASSPEKILSPENERVISPVEGRIAAPSRLTTTTLDTSIYREASAPSGISRGTSASLQKKNKLIVPPPPKKAKSSENFVCDYCCLILPSKIAYNRNSWIDHVKKDLDPYVCVVDDCNDPIQIYASRKDWLAHMQTRHLMRWYCVIKPHTTPIVFEHEKDFIEHMKSEHSGKFKEDQLPIIAHGSSHPRDPTFDVCPFCDENSTSLEEHVSQHLCDLAIRSLPWPEDDEQSSHQDYSSVNSSSTDLTRSTIKNFRSELPEPKFDDDLHGQSSDFKVGQRLVSYPDIQEIVDQHKPLDRAEQLNDGILRTFASYQYPDINLPSPSLAAIYRPQDEQNLRCLQDLRLSDPLDDKTRIKGTEGDLCYGACDWIFGHEDFLKWKDGNSRLLWIKGGPGTGKTMLMISIAEELERQLKQPKCSNALSYFFCQGTNKDLNNATSVLRGLVYLLIKQHPQLISHLRKKYDDAGPRLFQDENSFSALSDILEDILHDNSLTAIYIVVDALDECITDLDLLIKLIIKQTAKLPHVKWIVSSRNRPDIEQGLVLDRPGIKLSLEIEANAKKVSGAINAFIDFKISSLSLLQRDSDAKIKVQKLMRERANGTFLWVALVARELEKADDWDVVDKVSQVPAGLDELYSQILGQIKLQEQWPHCQRVLSTATLAYRPLHISELASISGLPEKISSHIERVRRIIALCGSFLTVQEDGIVYLIHQSVKDYLNNQVTNYIFPAGQAQIHHDMMHRSLKVMERTLQRDIYGLRQPGIFINEIEIPNPDPLTSIRYSCVYWINHFCEFYYASDYKNRERLGKLVYGFLRQFYLFWLEALGFLQGVGDGILLLTKLRNLAKEQSWDQQLVVLIEDSYRFIRQNKWILKNAPLQIYTSALIFCPMESLIRKLFTKEEPDWIRIKPVVEKTWDPCQQTLEGHSNQVNSVAFSPDSKFMASGSDDNTVKIWEAATGSLQQTFEGHGDSVNSVAFSPDSKLVASGSRDNTVKIWNTVTGALQQTLEEHSDSVNSVAFSPDSKLVASCSADKTVKIWEMATGALQQTLKWYSDSVRSVAFSQDLKLMASGSDDKTIKIWNTVTGALQQTLEGHDDSVTSIAFSPDSKLVASGSSDNTVKIWNTAMGAMQQTLKGHSQSVTSVVFSLDSKLVASGSSDKTIKIWDAATGPLQQALEGHGDWVRSVAFSPDSKFMASGSDDKTVKIWEAATGALQQTLEGHSDSVNSVAFSPDSKLVASGSGDKTIKIWNTATGALQQTLEGHGSWVTSVAFSPDSKLVVSGSDDKTVKIWEAATGALQQNLEGNGNSIISVFSRSGSGSGQISLHSYSVTSDKSWISWNGQKLLWLPPDYRYNTLAISPLTLPSMAPIIALALEMPSGKVTIMGFLASGPMELTN